MVTEKFLKAKFDCTKNNDQAGEGLSLSTFLTNVQSSNEEMRIAETEFH